MKNWIFAAIIGLACCGQAWAWDEEEPLLFGGRYRSMAEWDEAEQAAQRQYWRESERDWNERQMLRNQEKSLENQKKILRELKKMNDGGDSSHIDRIRELPDWVTE